jgi:hypothetical protein
MSNRPTGYRYSADFPREAFVQEAIERHFKPTEFQRERHETADLVCHSDRLKQRWIIEAKGETSDIGLDFRTGLGQLLRNMSNPDVLYGLAVPETPRFLQQCRSIDKWVRQALNLHWLIVQPDSSVRIVNPSEEL